MGSDLPPQNHLSGKTQEDAASPTAPLHKKYLLRRRRAYGRRAGDAGTSDIWLVSFTDVVALLMTFFVMLYAMSVPKEVEWQEMTENVQASFNRFYGAALHRGTEDATAIERVRLNDGLNLYYLKTLFESLIAQEENLGRVKVALVEDGLILSLPEDLLFETGQAQVGTEGMRALYVLGASLQRVRNRVEVIGHADPRGMAGGGRYESNWELSFDRAAQVAGALQRTGYQKPLGIRGYASARYRDLPETLSEAERRGLSRRVDIMIMEDDATRVKVLEIIGR